MLARILPQMLGRAVIDDKLKAASLKFLDTLKAGVRLDYRLERLSISE